MKNNPSHLFLKIERNGKTIVVIKTKEKRRFLNRLARTKVINGDLFDTCITYQPIINIKNQRITPQNKGVYKSKTDLKLALSAFLEK